ncbi:MAG: D-amino acid dehydrogenase [Burkholderiaceae bacterium]|nr:D-amino acid dehydrogenase [Burkholderiaceae bacterium]
MKALVVGAGVVGVTTAWFLNRQGFEVVVVDRGQEPASETSFANGGQISVSHAEPWANPKALRRALRWLLRADAPLRLRLRADPRQWTWLARFVRECTRERTRRNIGELVRLGTYSRKVLQQLRADTGISYDERLRGILHLYTDPREFEAAREPALLMRELGCERSVVSVDEAIAIEPALRNARSLLVGATFTPADESGDAHAFTLQLAALCRAAGVEFRMGHRVTALRTGAGRIEHVEAIDPDGRYETIRADRYVLAAGSCSASLAAPLGIRLAVYPAKGYSVTMPVRDSARAFEVSMTDDEHKLVFSRLGDRLRIAGTAELAGYGRALDLPRCRAMLRRFEQLMPGAGDATAATFWSGLRPATPSNCPYVGRTRLPDLFLNTGHGTLGWTLACGSAKALADLMVQRRPDVDYAFCGPTAERSRTSVVPGTITQ